MKRFTSFLLLFLLTITLSGCKKPNPDGREDVTGTITLNGGSLGGAGTIFFEPLDGNGDGGGRGPIMETGHYKLTGPDGVKPGKYRVRFSCVATYDKKTNAPRTAETMDYDEYKVRVIPPEFNEKSTLEFEVVAGKKNVFGYNIETSFVPDTTGSKSQKPPLPK